VGTVDAKKISEEELGRYFPNVPMLGAIMAMTGLVEKEQFIKSMEESFHHKFATKPEVIDGNVRALKRAMEEVRIS
jgi:pyruvate ferredoxin oxidoreductase gamma subunit